jgi:hypothetical protein
METTIKIKKTTDNKDFFPALFSNKDNSIIILADERTSEKTFSGMIVHIEGEKGKGVSLGVYLTTWTYVQFSRLPKYSEINLTIVQND